MDDRIRISDADRDRVTARLQHHFAEGRLTREELDERVSATLNAKTFGDLHGVMADLPEPNPAAPREGQSPPRTEQAGPWGGPRWMFRRRGPRLLPLVLLALLVVVVAPSGGWLLVAFLKVILVFWLLACLAGIVVAGLFRRRMRRYWRSGSSRYSRSGWPGGYGQGRRCSRW